MNKKDDKMSKAYVSISKTEASILLKLMETSTVEYTVDEKVAIERLHKEINDVLKYWTKVESLVIQKTKSKLETVLEEANKINPDAKLSDALNLINENKINKNRKTITGEAGKRILNRKGVK